MGVSAKGRRKGDRSVPAAEPAANRPGAKFVVLAVALAVVAVGWYLLQPSTPGPERDAVALMAHCKEGGPNVESCVQADIDAVLRANGQAAAFTLLSQVAQDPVLAGRDHAMAHHLGHVAFEVVGDPAKALADCPPGMGSGCTHGVVEAYLDARGPDASLAGLCDAAGPGAIHASHQCWHGVGHGLMMANDYDWAAAVVRCNDIADALDRVDCASGVFMQNLMGDPTMDMGTEGPHHAMPMAPVAQRFRPDDLLYPCRLVNGTAAQIGCWQNQPFVVQQLTNGSVEKMFWACAQAGEFAVMCEEGVGQAAGAQSRITKQPVLAYCVSAGNKTVWIHCMMGAVKDLIQHANSIVPGLEVCGNATADYALECYGAVGLMHNGLENRPEVRWANCATVAEAYRYACAALAAPR